MLEKNLVAKIRRELGQEWPDSFWFKVPGTPQLAGIPDLIGCVQGQFVALEVKRPDTYYDVTPRQQANLNLARRAGGIAGVVRSVEEAIELVSAGLG